jgi:hypothetical protein
MLLETSATLTDEILDLNDRLLGSMFAKAKRDFEVSFQDAGRAINDKVRLYAKVGQALPASGSSAGREQTRVQYLMTRRIEETGAFILPFDGNPSPLQ